MVKLYGLLALMLATSSTLALPQQLGGRISILRRRDLDLDKELTWRKYSSDARDPSEELEARGAGLSKATGSSGGVFSNSNKPKTESKTNLLSDSNSSSRSGSVDVHHQLPPVREGHNTGYSGFHPTTHSPIQMPQPAYHPGSRSTPHQDGAASSFHSGSRSTPHQDGAASSFHSGSTGSSFDRSVHSIQMPPSTYHPSLPPRRSNSVDTVTSSHPHTDHSSSGGGSREHLLSETTRSSVGTDHWVDQPVQHDPSHVQRSPSTSSHSSAGSSSVDSTRPVIRRSESQIPLLGTSSGYSTDSTDSSHASSRRKGDGKD